MWHLLLIIEDTPAPDGDPLDILVVCDYPIFPGCIVPARVLGYPEMTDGGKTDYKLISVVDCDPRYAGYQELAQLPSFIRKEISNFFDNYKLLHNIIVSVKVGIQVFVIPYGVLRFILTFCICI